MLGGRPEAEGKGERNLYITRACADIWKGTRQLVYELTVLSFSLSLSLSLSPALCGLSPSHSVSPSVSFGFVLVFRCIQIVPLFHSVLPLPYYSVLPSDPLGLFLVFHVIRI